MNLVTKFIGKILAGTLVVIFLIAIIGLAILPKVSNAISDSLEDKTAEIEEQVRSEIEIQILSIEKQIDSLTDEIELKIVDRTEALEIRVISQMSYETKRILREIELLKIG
jgi:type II secretory pathway pseudopilin PulG